MKDLIFGIILGALLGVTLTLVYPKKVVSGVTTYPWVELVSKEVCVNNEGYTSLKYIFEGKYIVKCKSGAEFTLSESEFRLLGNKYK